MNARRTLFYLILFFYQATFASDFKAGLLTSNDESTTSIGFSFLNERESEEKAGDSNGSWGIDLHYSGFQSKKDTGDRAQSLDTAFREITENFLELSLGINLSSASLEKISMSEPFLAIGKLWSLSTSKDLDWVPTLSAVLKLAHGSISQVDSANAISLSRDSVELKLDAFYWESVRLHLTYHVFLYSKDLSSTLTNTSASRNITHPEGVLFNSLYTLPNEYRNIGADIFFSRDTFLQIAAAQAHEKISGLYSQNIHLQINKHINSVFGVSVGGGTLQSSDGLSNYGSAAFSYQF